MTQVFVGLGANIGDPREQLKAAISALAGLPDTRLTATSSLYRSAPLEFADQPDFLNAVAQLDTGLAPEALLDGLQGIENRLGRVRPFPGAPRTLDLDLLLYGDQRFSSPRLSVPHPRMHERAFVLRPLTEIAPEASIPGRGKARDLLAACAAQRAERIA